MESLEDRRLLATLTVVTSGDAGNGTCTAGQCTLRDAITVANSNGEADQINFAPSVRGTITLSSASGQLPIDGPVDIVGPGSTDLTVRADTVSSEFRIFAMSETAGDVSVQGLTLTGGRVMGEPGGAILFQSSGTLTVRDSVITGNVAANGAGIYSELDGNLVVQQSSITGNNALYGSGGGLQTFDGNITVTSSMIDGNTAYNSGGGIRAGYGGMIELTDSQVTNNIVTEPGYNGGGISSDDGSLTITGSTISGNTSAGDGGGVYSYGGPLNITGSTINHNDAAYSGGAILTEVGSIDIADSTIQGNSADQFDGGGIALDQGSLTLRRSTLSGNASILDGGGIATSSGNVLILDSTISGNTAGDDGGGVATLSGLVSITNSTISGNSAAVDGGGVQSARAPVSVINSTLTLNRADRNGGGIGVIANNDGEMITIANSIVAQNLAGDDADFTAPGGPISNLQVDHSLIGDNNGTRLNSSPLQGGIPQADARGNLVGGGPNPVIDPMLGPLSLNGGQRETHVPADTSLAIDAGDDSLAIDPGTDGLLGGGDDTALINDARAFPFLRFVDGGSGVATVDMGAVELQDRPIYVVDTTDDIVNGDLSPGDRSLREVLALTNQSLGADVIEFAPSLNGTINLDPAFGALVIEETTSISGPGADQLTISPLPGPSSDFRIFEIGVGAGDVSIAGFTLSGGNPDSSGGAIRFESAGTLVVSHSTVRNNDTGETGGGIFSSQGDVRIVASTIEGNDSDSHGGGIAALAGTVEVIASTLSDNDSNAIGGGIYSVDAEVRIVSSTVTLNIASLQGGGIGFVGDDDGESLTIENSIVAANIASGNADFNAPGDAATNLSVDFSLIGDNAGTTLVESALDDGVPQPDARGNLIGGGSNPVIDPGLGSLADNGGPTQTHALLEGSLAIDQGSGALLPVDTFDIDGDGDTSETLPTDQRGASRNANGAPDMGAVEIPAAAPLTWDTPADIVFGTPLSSTQLNAMATVDGTFDYTPGLTEVLNAGVGQTLSVLFTPDDPLTFRPSTITTQINVLKATPVIDWDNPADINFGTLLSATQLNAVTSPVVAGSFSYSPDIGHELGGGQNQPLMTTFTPDDTANFNEVEKTVLINVNPSDPVITWENPDDIVFGETLSSTQLNATVAFNGNPVAGTLDYSPGIGELLNAGDGQSLMVTFRPSNTANFNEVRSTVQINVAKATPVIDWSDPDDIDAGTALSETQLNATVTGVDGTLVYTPGLGVVLEPGENQPLQVTFTPDDQDNFNSAMRTVQIDVIALFDFGDAPSQYPVTLADDGARHVTGSLRLGTDVDIDPDGQPSAGADGDGADDDGVTPIAAIIADSTIDNISSVQVIASEAGLLDAWIDFDGNGSWDDANEQIAANLSLVPGANTVSFMIPGGAMPGDTAARFRLSVEGSLLPTGEAATGEVEDYIVSILDGSVGPDATVALPANSGTVRRDQDNLSVSDGSGILLRAPRGAMDQLSVQSGTDDDTITLDFSGGDIVPSGGLQIDGGGGENTLVLSGQDSNLDLTTTGMIDLSRFSQIDLTDVDANEITIDASVVSQLAPGNKTVLVVGGEDDEVFFEDAADWRMTTPLVVDTTFIRVATNTVSGEVVQFDLPDPWQNPIDRSDVNNDGSVTANDALVVINELARRGFSSRDTTLLNDPLTTVPWPNVYYDQSGDGQATALDALRVINQLARLNASGEQAELLDALMLVASSPTTQLDTNSESLLAGSGPLSLDSEVICSLHDEESSAALSSMTALDLVDPISEGEKVTSEETVDQLLGDSSFLELVLG